MSLFAALARVGALLLIGAVAIAVTLHVVRSGGDEVSEAAPSVNVNSATALLSILPDGRSGPFRGRSTVDNPHQGLFWDRCNTEREFYGDEFLPRIVGPVIEVSYDLADDRYLVFGFNRFLHDDGKRFLKALNDQPRSCVAGDSGVLHGIDTFLKAPRIGDASYQSRLTIAEVDAESRVAGPGTELGGSHVVAVSGEWYIRAEADQRTLDEALPLIFAALNRHLGTQFTYHRPYSGVAPCNLIDPSAPGGLTAKQAQSLLVLHDAACRRDYRTLRHHMAHDFTHNGVTVRPEKLVYEWQRTPATAKPLLAALTEALRGKGTESGPGVVAYRAKDVTVRFDTTSLAWIALDGAPPPQHPLGKRHWMRAALSHLDCGSLQPEYLYDVEPIAEDVTGDGLPDPIAVVTCETGNNSYPHQVETFDGASDPAAPRSLGVLLSASSGVKVRTITVTGTRVKLRGAKAAPGDPSGCLSLRAERTMTWRGSTFKLGRLSITQAPWATCA